MKRKERLPNKKRNNKEELKDGRSGSGQNIPYTIEVCGIKPGHFSMPIW
jgi:hypothetical protein